jgi:hypothetical protein
VYQGGAYIDEIILGMTTEEFHRGQNAG